jgi:hypothetical protein
MYFGGGTGERANVSLNVRSMGPSAHPAGAKGLRSSLVLDLGYPQMLR